MAGLILGLLGAACLALLIQKIRVDRRIRRMAGQVEGFHAGTENMLDVALGEDGLARLQNGIADTQQALQRQRQLYAQECDRTSQLTTDISHQLKTPLSTLRLYTEMDEGPHMAQCLEQIQRMESLIGSLLRLERLCADGYAFHFVFVEAETVIQEQWEGLQPLWPGKKLHIQGSACIRCDAQWLGEAFLNLLKNACEHTGPDGEIWVSLERTEAVFFCVMEDNGGGVEETHLPRLFQRFYRAEHRSGGVGIGLAIVKEIIQRHHGTIVAENGPRGLKMTVSMPMLDANLTNP